MAIIHLKVYNEYSKDDIAKIEFPYDHAKAMNGFYSDFWRTMKKVFASTEQVDKHWVRLKFWKSTGKTDRMKMRLPSGTIFDAPFELNKTDHEILSLHFKALKLAIKNK